MVEFDHLSVVRLTRHYGRRRALSDISFDCHAGEVIALVGPNGAGKSTLLSILSTLTRATSGDVRYGVHTALAAGASLRRRLGWLGHDLQLYPELTARENLHFFARLSGADGPDASVARALELARLESRADDPVGSFSRGMRQRLALERALIHDPRLVLLDEPFTGLDRASTEGLAARLRTLAARARLVVLATHDASLPDGVIDRAVVLDDGRLVEIVPGRLWREALAPPPAGDN